MQSFKQFIAEQGSEMKAPELAAKIEELFKKYFKNSNIYSKFENNLGSGITVQFTLGKDKSEYNNGISHNDPMRFTIMVYGMSKDGTLSDKLSAESAMGTVNIVDKTGKYHTTSIKVFRKFSGDQEKIVKGFDNFFKKLHTTVKENIEGIQPLVNFDVKSKI